MPCEVQFHQAFTEIITHGDVTPLDVLGVVRRMHANDPRKERPDLWVLSPESVVPLSAFAPLIEALKSLCAQIRVGTPSAIVSTNAFQRAQLALYLVEASALPFTLRIFESRPDAVAWLDSLSTPAPQATQTGQRMP